MLLLFTQDNQGSYNNVKCACPLTGGVGADSVSCQQGPGAVLRSSWFFQQFSKLSDIPCLAFSSLIYLILLISKSIYL